MECISSRVELRCKSAPTQRVIIFHIYVSLFSFPLLPRLSMCRCSTPTRDTPPHSPCQYLCLRGPKAPELQVRPPRRPHSPWQVGSCCRGGDGRYKRSPPPASWPRSSVVNRPRRDILQSSCGTLEGQRSGARRVSPSQSELTFLKGSWSDGCIRPASGVRWGHGEEPSAGGEG